MAAGPFQRASRPPREGVRARHHPFAGHLKAGPGLGPALALAIGRRSGGATVRSRIKRLLREAFREAAPRLPEGAQVEITAHGDLSRLPRRAAREAAAALLGRLIQQWRADHPSHDSSAGASSASSGSTRA